MSFELQLCHNSKILIEYFYRWDLKLTCTDLHLYSVFYVCLVETLFQWWGIYLKITVQVGKMYTDSQDMFLIFLI